MGCGISSSLLSLLSNTLRTKLKAEKFNLSPGCYSRIYFYSDLTHWTPMYGSQNHQMGEGKCETRTGGCQLWDHFLTALLLHSVSQEPGPSHNPQTNQLEATLPFPGISLFPICTITC